MKILNLIQCTNLGGMEHASLRLMKDLKARGHEIELLSLHPLGELRPLLAEAGIPAEGMPYRGKGGWRSFPNMCRRLRSAKRDALIMTGHHFLAMMALDRNPSGQVLAIHFHHRGVKPEWQWRLIYNCALERFQNITFPSDLVRKEAEAIHPELKGRAETVHNGIVVAGSTTEAQRLAARVALDLPTDRILIGNAGWLIARKRWDIFLATARKVLEREPNAFFVVAGDGPLRADLVSTAGKLGLENHIRWLGWRQNIREFYQATDILHFNSDFDALCVTPLEAMSHGLPVVASVAYGGLSEIISDASVGTLLAHHDTDVLAAEILRLAADPNLRHQIGEAAMERIRETCDPWATAIRYEKLLTGSCG